MCELNPTGTTISSIWPVEAEFDGIGSSGSSSGSHPSYAWSARKPAVDFTFWIGRRPKIGDMRSSPGGAGSGIGWISRHPATCVLMFWHSMSNIESPWSPAVLSASSSLTDAICDVSWRTDRSKALLCEFFRKKNNTRDWKLWSAKPNWHILKCVACSQLEKADSSLILAEC